MLKLTACCKDHRVFIVRRIIRCNNACRCELRASILAWETIAKHNRLTRIRGRKRWVRHRVFTFKAIPCDVTQRFHVQLHFGKNFAWVRIGPAKPKAFRQLNFYPPVFTRLTGGRNSRTSHLNLAVGVCDGAGLFRKCRSRQNYISVVCGLSDKNILHHKVVQLGQRGTCMIYIGV